MECFHSQGNVIAGCNAGAQGIPAAIANEGGVAALTVANGVITVTPENNWHGIVTGDTYVLKPNVNGGTVTWTSSGGGVTKGYAK